MMSKIPSIGCAMVLMMAFATSVRADTFSFSYLFSAIAANPDLAIDGREELLITGEGIGIGTSTGVTDAVLTAMWFNLNPVQGPLLAELTDGGGGIPVISFNAFENTFAFSNLGSDPYFSFIMNPGTDSVPSQASWFTQQNDPFLLTIGADSPIIEGHWNLQVNPSNTVPETATTMVLLLISFCGIFAWRRTVDR